MALQLFQKLSTLIGFSGSDLNEIHLNTMKTVIAGRILNMKISDVFKPTTVNHGADVYSSITDYRAVI